MADNTLLNTGVGGDTIRDLARAAGTIKTQVVQLDLGGVTANAEVLITAGQQLMAVSVPVVIASNQTSIPVSIASSAAPTTYSATVGGLALAATATDIFTLTGSATKTVRITKVWFNAIETTAAQVAVILLRRSTANTVGTSTAQTATTYDSTNVAATATVLAYTANPTTGTLVGNLFTQRVFVPGAATASDAQGLSLSYGDFGQQGIVLRGIAQVFAINLGGVTVVGGSANATIEWTES